MACNRRQFSEAEARINGAAPRAGAARRGKEARIQVQRSGVAQRPTRAIKLAAD